MTDPQRYALAADVILQIAGDEALLVKLHDEDMFALNETGAAIVQGVAAGQDVDAVVDELAHAYQAERSAVAADVDALIAELLARGLLTRP